MPKFDPNIIPESAKSSALKPLIIPRVSSVQVPKGPKAKVKLVPKSLKYTSALVLKWYHY